MELKEKIILFDIDHTLLDTPKMAKSLANMVCEESGIPMQQFKKSHSRYVAQLEHYTKFDFLELVESLNLVDDIVRTITNRYRDDITLYPSYSGVLQTIRDLYDKGYKLGIVSEGTPHFQKIKLKNLQIDKYLSPELIFIVSNKRKDEFLSSLPRSIIVDDNKDVCNLIHNHGKHTVIHFLNKIKVLTPEMDKEVDNRIKVIENITDLTSIL